MEFKKLSNYIPVDRYCLIDGKLHQEFLLFMIDESEKLRIEHEYIEVEDLFTFSEKLILGREIQLN
jgi:hypothetical protein